MRFHKAKWGRGVSGAAARTGSLEDIGGGYVYIWY